MTNESGQFIQILITFLFEFLQILLSILFGTENSRQRQTPVSLGDGQHTLKGKIEVQNSSSLSIVTHLMRMANEPLLSNTFLEIIFRLFDTRANSGDHVLFDLFEPIFDVARRLDLEHFDTFAFGREHRANLWCHRHRHFHVFATFRGEFQTIDAFETFAQMRLNGQRISRLRKNFQQFLVGQEIESGKIRTFRLEIRGESVLNLIEERVVRLKQFQIA